MTDTNQPNVNLVEIHEKAKRIASAIFLIMGNVEGEDVLKLKIKNLSLDFVSDSIRLKESLFSEFNKTILEIQKNCLELMSFLDIASVSGLISKMNGDIIKNEFDSFILEINNLSENFDYNNRFHIQSLFQNAYLKENNQNLSQKIESNKSDLQENNFSKSIQNLESKNKQDVGGGYKRKNLRRSAIMDFIKGHNNVSIKDILPNITGCSEKTIQRELIELIKEGKISKIGERRWSKYSIV